jgi:AcrR family transcriptional regulator
MAVFAEEGFGAAKMEEVARRAGVAKGTVFVYFPTKKDLFRAVAQTLLDANFSGLDAARAPDLPLDKFVPFLLGRAAHAGQTGVPAIARILIAEARSFPDLAQVWHDEVVAKMLGILTTVIARAQARGEVREGDPRLHAFSIIGPVMAGVLFREIFRDTDADLPNLENLAAQHAETIIKGLRSPAPEGV